ncbi:Nucleosomal histone H3-Lys79 methylase [Elasticomyces elasticus]|nr:Nucleosomal histone H3-Lys79 methylase [Elasticomyces elasticus]
MNWNTSAPAKGVVAKKPVIRKTTVQVAVNGSKAPASVPASARQRDPNRFQLSQTTRRPAPTKRPSTAHARALEAVRGVKRKSASADVNQFSDEEDDSSDVGTTDSEASRKRPKSSVSSVDSLAGPRRKLVSEEAFRVPPEPLDLIHGADATSTSKYRPPFEDDDFSTVELQYPSRHRERFELKMPKRDDYEPMTDIQVTIESIVTFYFPDDLSGEYLHDDKAFHARITRAFIRHSVSEMIEIVEEFNALLKTLVEDGTVQAELRQHRSLALQWVKRILDQVYARTVSPRAEKLNNYKIGSSNVYGELMPRFVSDIFRETKLNHEQVFVDLGSGVGNVVLQAALQVGCESWGIEMQDLPCEMAAMQAAEFRARTQLWGLQTGEVHLLEGDMTKHPKVPALLQRADVILVNNQAFQPDLNDKLLNYMFLDLKPGARVVSLKPFVPIGHKMTARNVNSVVNQFVQKPLEYFSQCPPKRKQPAAAAAPKAAPKRRSKLAKENNITPDQEAEIAEAFALFSSTDDSKHGVILTSELRRCLVALNAPPANQDEMNEILDTVDPEKTGRVAYEHFVAIAALKLNAKNDEDDEEAQQEEIARAYRLFTGGEDRPIQLGDLKRVAKELREEFPDGVLRDMVREATGGGLGGVGKEEFEGVMKRAGVFG